MGWDHQHLARVALVVEDDRTLRDALVGYLEDESFEVFTAPTLGRARHCLEKREKRSPGVVVLDLALDDGDGEALVADIDAMVEPPALVVISAQPTRAAHLANRYGVPFLVKPFDLELAGATILVAHERGFRPRRREASGMRRRVPFPTT